MTMIPLNSQSPLSNTEGESASKNSLAVREKEDELGTKRKKVYKF